MKIINKKILVIGSTGKLGSKLLNFCFKNKIYIDSITSYKNLQKMKYQKERYSIKKSFCLSLNKDLIQFNNFIKTNNFGIIYFLDYGSQTLELMEIFLKKNTHTIFAIANKELLIAGGPLLINKINKSKNFLIPLDSEHFSLYRSNPKNLDIYKIFITASGGPFYFKKRTNLNNVSLNQVLKHPKWKMGINNSIDSSNFINKVLEVFELASIYNIDINKINFLVSQEAYIHSIIYYNDMTISINCFNNDMIISLSKPLEIFFQKTFFRIKKNPNFLDSKYLKLSEFNDKRYKIYKYINSFKKFTHKNQIKFMILNNIAQKKYLNRELKYNDIVSFIMKKIDLTDNDYEFKSFKNILSYINEISNYYDKK